MNENYYELRHVIKSDKKSLNFYFDDTNNSKTLEDNIFEHDKIVLLGNPGIGKSTELENLFNLLWNKIDSNGIVPFSINLKNFRPINDFEDLLGYEDWQSLPQIIFILDGLDEISEIEDFLSAFEIFINKNKSSNYKYIISCRTNIFEKYLVKISNFETFYLEDLNFEQSSSILKKKFDIDLEKVTLSDKHYQYLRTPFFLNLFAEYYILEGKLPDSDAKMWESYVKKHLEIHKTKIKKNRIFNIPQEVKDLKKIAFINEFQQKNFITSDELNEVIGVEYIQLIENPFLVNLENEREKFSFEHRQIQEYFVAKTLSEKKFEDILSIIKIGTIEKVHPTLFNSMSFLINLMEDGESRNKLIDWIEEHQLELLIRADSDKINEDLKVRVFKHYFEEICIKKTYWITTDRTFSVNEIAKFGDCETNFDYLIDIINNRQMLFRVRISALNLISYFNKISISKHLYLKDFLMKNLKFIDNSKQIKASILHCIAIKKICMEDENYLKKILDIFKNETNKEINIEILNIINEFGYIDPYSDFIEEEFLREINVKKREEIDEVIRGNSYVLNQLVLKLKNSNKFINFAQYYFDPEKNIDVYSSDLEELIQKCINFDKQDEEFIVKLFKKIDFEKQHFYLEKPITELLSRISTNSINKVFKYLMDSYEFNDVNYILSRLTNEENIWYVINKFKAKKDFEQKEIELFRNFVANESKRDVARIFNDEMLKIGFLPKEELLLDNEITKIRRDFENKPQKNFNILFKKEKLLKEFKNIFVNNGQQISKERYYEIHKEWYSKNGHGNTIDISLKMLNKLIRKLNKPIEFNDIEEHIEDDSFVFQEIKVDLENNKRAAFKIKVSESQKEFIASWVARKINEINFNNIFKSYSDNYTLLNDYKKWEYVIFFSRELDLILPEGFLLHSLIIPETKNHGDNQTLFDYIKENIADKKTFDNKVKENLELENLPPFVFDQHISYAIQKKLKLTFPDIRKHLLNEEREYNMKTKLYDFYNLENDVELLKECATNINSFKAWDAISILMEENLERNFCNSKALEYLEKIDDDLNKRFITNSLNVLFQLNSIEAIKYYYKFLSIDLYASAYSNYFANYDNIQDYSILESFFNKIYLDNKFDRSFNNSANFLNQYVSNLSKYDDSYNKVKSVLLDIRSKLMKEKNDKGIFQINLLIDISDNTYYNAKSKPLEFKKALERVNEII